MESTKLVGAIEESAAAAKDGEELVCPKTAAKAKGRPKKKGDAKENKQKRDKHKQEGKATPAGSSKPGLRWKSGRLSNL